MCTKKIRVLHDAVHPPPFSGLWREAVRLPWLPVGYPMKVSGARLAFVPRELAELGAGRAEDWRVCGRNLTEAARKPSALCTRTCASVPVRVDWRGCGPGSLRVMAACVERDSRALSRGESRSLLPPVPAALRDLVFLCVSPFPILEGGPNGCISYFCAIVLFLHPQKRCPVTGRALSEVCPDNEPISETLT